MIDVVRIETPTLGDRSYLVHDGEVGLVVDPQRDIDRITALAARLGVRITHVAETHMHNDYVSGGLALSRACGASYLVTAAEPVSFARTPVSDGDSVDVSDAFRIRVAATPGHTFNHLPTCSKPLAMRRASSPAGRCSSAPPAAPTCSARTTPPRLPGPSMPPRGGSPASCLTAPRSYPTHGFGSFCAATQAAADSRPRSGGRSWLNPALTLDEAAYVETLLAGLDAWPAYYAQMGPANRPGPAGPDLTPPQLADARRAAPPHRGRRVGRGPARPHRFRRRVPARLVQLHPRRQLRHLPGLGHSVGHPGHPARRRRPSRWRRPSGNWSGSASTGPPPRPPGSPGTWAGGQPLAYLRLATFGDLAAAIDHRNGRRRPRRAAPAGMGRRPHRRRAPHPASTNCPAGPAGPAGEVWVHCRTGYRSTIAASHARRPRPHAWSASTTNSPTPRPPACPLEAASATPDRRRRDERTPSASHHHEVLIVGGGTAGITVAARLRRAGVTDIAIVEPSDQHYYQPLWTLVGGGRAPPSATVRPEAERHAQGRRLDPRGAPPASTPKRGPSPPSRPATLSYDYLVVAPGMQLDFDKVSGLTEALGQRPRVQQLPARPRPAHLGVHPRPARRHRPVHHARRARSSAPAPRRRSPTWPPTGGAARACSNASGSSWCCPPRRCSASPTGRRCWRASPPATASRSARNPSWSRSTATANRAVISGHQGRHQGDHRLRHPARRTAAERPGLGQGDTAGRPRQPVRLRAGRPAHPAEPRPGPTCSPSATRQPADLQDRRRRSASRPRSWSPTCSPPCAARPLDRPLRRLHLLPAGHRPQPDAARRVRLRPQAAHPASRSSTP